MWKEDQRLQQQQGVDLHAPADLSPFAVLACAERALSTLCVFPPSNNQPTTLRAPEQFAPGCRTTNKVDIWGFAATLLHMITGSPPWQHDTLMQICTAVGVAKQAPPLPEGLPGPVQALLATCFDADPARRPTAVHLLKVGVLVAELFGG